MVFVSDPSGTWGDALTLSVAKMSRKLGGLYIARKLVDHLADPTTAQALKAVAVQPKTKIGQAAILHIARLIVSEQMAPQSSA